MKCPCEECPVLAMCLIRIEKYKSRYLVASLSKRCIILSAYIYKNNKRGPSLRGIEDVRDFFTDKKRSICK